MKKIILIYILLFSFYLHAEEKADPQHKVKVGEIAPAFTIHYADGKSAKLSDLKGKVVMLQFTASWCSVCLREMPFIESEIWQKLKDNPDFVLVAIDFKESPDKIPHFRKAAKVTYPMALDTTGAIFELYAEKDAGVTRNYIINKTGHIAFLTRLFDREEFDAMKRKIWELLGEE